MKNDHLETFLRKKIYTHINMYLMHGICKICHGKTGMIKSVRYFQDYLSSQ